MSLVQIAYQTVLTRLRDWPKLDSRNRLESLLQASSLMGQSFRVAMYILEEEPHRIIIEDHEMFYSMLLDKEKFLLFKSNSRVRLNDCTCKSSWLRKTGEQAPYMCIHQILIELILHVFSEEIEIHKAGGEEMAQLS